MNFTDVVLVQPSSLMRSYDGTRLPYWQHAPRCCRLIDLFLAIVEAKNKWLSATSPEQFWRCGMVLSLVGILTTLLFQGIIFSLQYIIVVMCSKSVSRKEPHWRHFEEANNNFIAAPNISSGRHYALQRHLDWRHKFVILFIHDMISDKIFFSEKKMVRFPWFLMLGSLFLWIQSAFTLSQQLVYYHLQALSALLTVDTEISFF